MSGSVYVVMDPGKDGMHYPDKIVSIHADFTKAYEERKLLQDRREYEDTFMEYEPYYVRHWHLSS
jgi:hypothetical protein